MFIFVETEDGSQSLRIEEPTGESESMHSLRGAFSETVYIYGSAIETCLSMGFPPRVLSLGLGLGYVELLSAALMLRNLPANLEHCGGESFELLPELREWFTGWVHGESNAVGVPPDFVRIYDTILLRTAQHVGVEAEALRRLFSQLLRDGRWLISGPLTVETEVSGKFGCICFDAFSSKTSPDLWTEPFLMDFLARAAAPGCVLSTYACTGALKRSLKESGFDVAVREGFASKRDSTFAIRKFTN